MRWTPEESFKILDPDVVDEYRSAMTKAGELRDEMISLASYYWTGDDANKLEDITGCLSDTEAMNRAAGEVGAAYRKLADALDGYRAAAKRALSEVEDARR